MYESLELWACSILVIFRMYIADVMNYKKRLEIEEKQIGPLREQLFHGHATTFNVQAKHDWRDVQLSFLGVIPLFFDKIILIARELPDSLPLP